MEFDEEQIEPTEGNGRDYRALALTLRTQAVILFGFIAVIWLLEGIDYLLGGRMDVLGIVPREPSRLWAIVLAPLLHVGFAHVAANTLPYLILGWFVLLRSVRVFLIVTVVTVLVSGLGTWLVGPRNSVHLGASGLIFGYFGYLLLRGYFERSWQAVLWSVLVAVLYGSMLFGVLPGGTGISWQMHLFGFLGGGFAAYLLAGERPQRS